MAPYEVMISESQERMVAVVRPERLDEVAEVCARWSIPCAVIGRVTADGEVAGDHLHHQRRLAAAGDAHQVNVPIDGEFPTEITEEMGVKKLELIFSGHPEVTEALKSFRKFL
jgi:phosphoribosylformylglycinamidine (FGAM) synthase-like enzyme